MAQRKSEGKLLNIIPPPRLSLARLPTPFHTLDRLSEQLGGPRIWVKRDDLTDCGVSGNKIRKLEFTLARVLEQNCDTIITCGGLQSNHCRATALLGARLGLRVHLILRGDNVASAESAGPDGNLFLDYLAGAEVSIYEKHDYQRRLPELFAHWSGHYKAHDKRPYEIPTGASDATGVWGYAHCVPELITDFSVAGIKPRAIIHATGSGGTQAGLIAGAILHELDGDIIGMAVCDNAQYFHDKVSADIRQWQNLYNIDLPSRELPIHVDERFIGPGYAQATDDVFAMIRRVASLEGLLLDPVYTGKAFNGMIEKIRLGEFSGHSDIVFVHTGGVFGLLAQASNFKF